MYLTKKHINDRAIRVFHKAGGNSDSFHALSVDLNILTDNQDALTVYMAVLWNKQDGIAWKAKRFNLALDWLVEHHVLHSTIADRYRRVK